MQVLFDLVNNIKKLNVNKILFEINSRKDVQDFIIKLNTKNQLQRGLDSKGEVLGFYKSTGYSLDKQKLSGRIAPFGVIDLRVTEDYYKTYLIQVVRDGFIIDSNTQKPDRDLRDIVGISEDIEGLTDDSIEKYVDFILPMFIDGVTRTILP